MTPSPDSLRERDLLHLAEACRREAYAHELERMLGECRCRKCSAGRAKFFVTLHHSYGWSVRTISSFTGRTNSAVHSAVYHGLEASK